MGKIAFMFDGQGAFKPGIGKDLYNRYPKAKKIIEKSSKILRYDLTIHLWGDEAQKTSSRTSIAQPAISVISLAYAEVLKDAGLSGDVSIGHSLGEMTSIIYNGIVSFEDGIRIVQKRGEVMEQGGEKGAMMAIINIELNRLEEMCKKVSQEISESVVVANINTPNQIVISGSKEGIRKIALLASQHQGRGIPLNVGGAWHSPYLKGAAEEFSKFLDTINFKTPRKKFYSLVEQRVLTDAIGIKESLKRQMLSQVNWVLAIENLRGLGYDTFVEIGPSRILKDLVSKITMDAKIESTALYTDLQVLVQDL